jgi:hypothetical protein
MRILYIGDIMARPGRQVVKSVLPKLKTEKEIDVVIAQAENVTHGKGMSPQHMKELLEYGVDVFSGGNHSPERPAIHDALDDPDQPVIRPANMSDKQPGRGFYLHQTAEGKVLVISILGTTFPHSHFEAHPLETVDAILREQQTTDVIATVVNFHGDFSSDKRIIGYYLDGRASLVVGDHWHVASADAMILPKGTAHMTDVGMCGTLHSSLGITMRTAIERWQTEGSIKPDIDYDPPFQFNAVLVEINSLGLATSIEHIYKQIND